MIIAIEGASAAGKTTWCRAHCPKLCVPESPENIAAPDLFADSPQVARFWVDHNIANWQRALAIEQTHGTAVCDGDPFHLYFSWALWKSGTLDRRLFDLERELYRDAFEHQRIGFVDQVFWLEVPEVELRRRAKLDGTRRRKRHAMYLSLLPWMKAWFDARERLLPGGVLPLAADLRSEGLFGGSSPRRYDLALMDAFLSAVMDSRRMQTGH